MPSSKDHTRRAFGGIKHPGHGREPGGMGIQEFVHKKPVRSGAVAAPG